MANNNLTSRIGAERKQVQQLVDKIGNPRILPDFINLSEKVDELYYKHLYRVETLHRICDEIYKVDEDEDEGEGEGEGEGDVSPYSVISLIYLINPRRTMSVFIDFLCSEESAERVIRNNARKLGIKVPNKVVPSIMNQESRKNEKNLENTHEYSLG